jgi:hypothetical protein
MCQGCVGHLRSVLFEDVMEYQTSLLRGPRVPLICWSKAVSGKSYPVGQLDEMDLPSINQRVHRQYEEVGLLFIVATTEAEATLADTA